MDQGRPEGEPEMLGSSIRGPFSIRGPLWVSGSIVQVLEAQSAFHNNPAARSPSPVVTFLR
jgi:hypothetical protein